MRVSRTARYALLVVAHLASDPCPHSAARLSAEAGVPASYIPKVVAPLLRSGVLDSQRGFGGGYILVADPHRLTAQDVIEAIDGPGRGMDLRDAAGCAVDQVIEAAVDQARSSLAGWSIARLAARLQENDNHY